MPENLTPSHHRWVFGCAICVPLLLLLDLGFLSHRSVQGLLRTANSGKATLELKALTEKLLIAMIDNETSRRGFIISQKDEFLEPYDRSLRVLPGLRSELNSGISDTSMRKNLAALNSAIDARLSFSAASVDLQKSGQHDSSVVLVTTGKGKALMDQVRVEEAKLEEQLDAVLRGNADEYLAVGKSNEFISWIIVIIDGLFGILLILLLLNIRRREQLLNVCAWSKTVEYGGEWITFEKYLDLRFGVNVTHGISPAEAKKFKEQLRKTTA